MRMEWRQASKVEGGYKIPERWVYLRYYEAFNLLFRIENALRVFVYIVLKNEFKDKWGEVQVIGEDTEGKIESIAKKRRGQSQSFGYLGHAIMCPIMHLTSGEMIRLITADCYWKLFKPYFLGSKEIIKNKLEEIGSIRNSLAHFRPIKPDDVDVMKQNSKHVLRGIEEFLTQALVQADVIPTNTDDAWYKQLKTLGTDQCAFTFKQSKDEQWVRLAMDYSCPVLKVGPRLKRHVSYRVLTIKSSAMLTKYPAIRRHVTYLTERVAYPRMLEDFNADFGKSVSFVLARKMAADQHEELKHEFEDLLLTIAKETELIEQDNLARGEIVHSVAASASGREGEKGKIIWKWLSYHLETPVQEADPPEYWGNLNFYGWEDFIAGTSQYPWMPERISAEDWPF
jgi:hypothetical protein